MAVQQLSAPAPRSGVVHIKFRHRDRFTVVGNHLAQHRELSLLAIGLAVHIQSVPDGTRVDIKSLTARFPEGEARIGAALRELEAYGYLARTARRMPDGRIVTRTVSYANPDAPDTKPPPPPSPSPASKPAPKAKPTPALALAPASVPTPPAPGLTTPPTPPDPVRQATATALLAALRRDDERLLLSERDVARLSPAVAVWLERGTGPEAVRRALTAHLPSGPLHSPAALVAHRLTAQLPPPLPATPLPGRPHPLHECPDCGRPFRAPTPGRCRDCRTTERGGPPNTPGLIPTTPRSGRPSVPGRSHRYPASMSGPDSGRRRRERAP
ncbi:hypothetical protein ABZY93_20970 [Streptomyces smyrnaeus]|uniref:hypothetical protein n=1 Tax=Streptomyces smyrnaeus TaxID=1387713 RepID=UPI0033A14BD6